MKMQPVPWLPFINILILQGYLRSFTAFENYQKVIGLSFAPPFRNGRPRTSILDLTTDLSLKDLQCFTSEKKKNTQRILKHLNINLYNILKHK